MSAGPVLSDFLPQPPAWRLDWPAIDQAFDWVRALRHCPQDPVWHAEGDVWIHTRMVCEALAGSAEWRGLDGHARFVLFAAALLHDVAKPRCTRTEPDGRVTSRGHSRRGAIAARRLLWHMAVPFGPREQIAGLVAAHQRPLFLFDRPDPRRLVIEASQRLRCDWLAVLAQADVLGRQCADQARLLEQVALFRELCREESCLGKPWQFPSAHTRFVYFRDAKRTPEVEAYDDTRCEAILLSGLPGAGKDHWAARNRLPLVSLDRIRKAEGLPATGNQGRVIQAAREQARAHLRHGQGLVWNATNVSRRIRRQCIDLFAAYGARVRIVYLETDARTQAARNAARAAPVPDAALSRMLDTWEVPDLTEAHAIEHIET